MLVARCVGAAAQSRQLYDTLLAAENPEDVDEGGSFTDSLNPSSLQVVTDAVVEPNLADVGAEASFQFERRVTSASIPIRTKAPWSSTAPSPYATPERKKGGSR